MHNLERCELLSNRPKLV